MIQVIAGIFQVAVGVALLIRAGKPGKNKLDYFYRIVPGVALTASGLYLLWSQ